MAIRLRLPTTPQYLSKSRSLDLSGAFSPIDISFTGRLATSL